MKEITQRKEITRKFAFATRVKNIEISGIRRAFEAASAASGSADSPSPARTPSSTHSSTPARTFNLGLGEPDFETPEHIKEAAVQALKSGFTSYTPNKGIPELREALSEKFKRENHFSVSPEEIIVTSGASEALHLALLAAVEKGDEVLVPNPGFVSFAPLTRLAEAKPVGVPLSEGEDKNEGFTMSAEAVKERITSRTKALILNSPANPTGAVESEENLKALVELANDHRLTLISDEVYERFIYDDGLTHTSPASLSEVAGAGFDEKGRGGVVTVNAVSKTYAMTGFRLGYLTAREEYVEQMLKIHQYIQACASSISQRAALAALTGPQDCVAAMKSEFKRRRDFVVAALREMQRAGLELEFSVPRGAFYIFPRVRDETEFVTALQRRGVVVTPGSAFGSRGKDHVRISYAASLEVLKRAFEVIQDQPLRFGSADRLDDGERGAL